MMGSDKPSMPNKPNYPHESQEDMWIGKYYQDMVPKYSHESQENILPFVLSR